MPGPGKWHDRFPWDAEPSSLPFLVSLAAADPDDQSFARSFEILEIECDQFGAAEGAGKSEEQQCPVALAEQRVREVCGGDFLVRDQYRLLVDRRDAEFAAQAGKKLLHRPGTRGRFEAGALVELADGRQAP